MSGCVNDLPLRAGDDGLRVNWCELTVSHELTGERLYHNSFVTSLPLDDFQVKEVTHAGRARWKHENKGHNVLTTRGYHIKHNFGHGHQHLATVMFTLNLLAFFLHTFLPLVDTTYRQIREALGARRTFFEDARSFLLYKCCLKLSLRGLPRNLSGCNDYRWSWRKDSSLRRLRSE
jgi:hypothetical protein